jgi:adenosylhomocysteine nucleosidase
LSKTGIVTALRTEAACLSETDLEPGRPSFLTDSLLLVLSGMGEERVVKAIDTLLINKVDALISFGTAGALHPDLKSGDIIIAENIVTASGQRQDITCRWRDSVVQNLQACPARIKSGDIAMTETVIACTADKRALRLRSGALAVDMESGLVAKAAWQHNLLALVIRIIVDEADTRLPAKVLESTDAYGDPVPGRLAGAIFGQPTLIADLLRLALSFRKAKHSMQWLGHHLPLLLPD